MSLSALVYSSRESLDIDVESLGAVRDERTGEYFSPNSQFEAEFPRKAFIASEVWIGNIVGVAEMREELRTIAKNQDSLLLKKCFYSGSHSGDLIETALLQDLESEICAILNRREVRISDHLRSALHGILGLVEAAKRERNPIVFV